MAGDLDRLLASFEENPQNIKFVDLVKVCNAFFGKPRQTGSSHKVYKTPWIVDPRVNIQNAKGKAKIYQVKQVLKAIHRLKEEGHA